MLFLLYGPGISKEEKEDKEKEIRKKVEATTQSTNFRRSRSQTLSLIERCDRPRIERSEAPSRLAGVIEMGEGAHCQGIGFDVSDPWRRHGGSGREGEGQVCMQRWDGQTEENATGERIKGLLWP